MSEPNSSTNESGSQPSNTSKEKLSGKTIRLNREKAAIFDDKLSGLRLDIFDAGEVGVIPDCSEEKLAVIKKALEHGILIPSDGEAVQGPQRKNIVDTSGNIDKECADFLLLGREKLINAIKRETQLVRIKTLTTLEEKGKCRVSVLRALKARLIAVAPGPQIKDEEVEEEFQIRNITEKTTEEGHI